MNKRIILAIVGAFALILVVSGIAVVRVADQGDGLPEGFGPALAVELDMNHAEVYGAFDRAVAEREAGGNIDVLGAAADELSIEQDVLRDTAMSLLSSKSSL